MPDHYERSLACIVAEEAAELALRQLAAGEAADVAALESIQAMTADRDMPDEVRAKLCKALGYALRDAYPGAALLHLERALQLNSKVGVKKDIERLEREIKNAYPHAPQGDEGAHTVMGEGSELQDAPDQGDTPNTASDDTPAAG